MESPAATGRKIKRIQYTPKQLSIMAYEKLIDKIEIINDGWIPDFNNSSERKYYPYFEFSGSAFRFSCTGSVITYTHIGARLCFKTKNEAEKFGRENVKLYKQWMDIEPPAK